MGDGVLRLPISSNLFRYQLTSINEELMLIDKKTNYACSSVEIKQNVCTFLIKINTLFYSSLEAQEKLTRIASKFCLR